MNIARGITLIAAAFIPYSLLGLGAAHLLDGGPAYLLVSLTLGASWLGLYFYVFHKTPPPLSKLLWFALLFAPVAFVWPVDLIILYLLLVRGGPGGVMP